MGVIAWIKQKRDKRIREKKEAKKRVFGNQLVDLREIFLAIDEIIRNSSKLSRPDKRRFWDEFKKGRRLKKEIFDLLLDDDDINKVVHKVAEERSKL